MQRWGARCLRVAGLKRTSSNTSSILGRHDSNLARISSAATEPMLSQKLSLRPPPSNLKTPIQERGAKLASEDVDPYKLVSSDLEHVRSNLTSLLGSSHPALTAVASYYFKHPSKQLRPLLVLLFAQATNGLGRRWEEKRAAGLLESADLDWPLSRRDVLTDWNPDMPEHTSSFEYAFDLISPSPPHKPARLTSGVHRSPPSSTLTSGPPTLPTQLRLAQIVEMIHVASLLHDDVIDASSLRRNTSSAPSAFGSKISVLAGDFMLARASAALSRLGEPEVVELISSVVANLVEGEVLQMRHVIAAEIGITDESKSADKLEARSSSGRVSREVWNVYLQKTYLKTASLMAKSARASVVLGGSGEGELWKEVAYAFGRNLGIAFQLVDDILDYEAAEGTLGKPGGADLKLGLATGPALFAWEEHPEMGPLIERKFEREGDVELARDLVRRSSGVERTRDLARTHADKAQEIIQVLPVSDARHALEILTERVVKRTW